MKVSPAHSRTHRLFPVRNLEDLPIEDLLAKHLLQPRVLFFQSFQLLGGLRLHTTILLPPAVIRLFGDFRKRLLATCKFRAPSCPYRVQHRLCEVWQRSDPLCDVSEALGESFPGSSPEQEFSHSQWCNSMGGGQPRRLSYLTSVHHPHSALEA